MLRSGALAREVGQTFARATLRTHPHALTSIIENPEMKNIWRCLAAGCCTVLLVGCGGGGAETVKVTGKVTAATPLSGASVTFHPVESGTLSTGEISADGAYELQAAPGSYKATVFVPTTQGSTDEGVEGVDGGADAYALPSKKDNPIDERYLTPETTPFEFQVADGAAPGSYDIKLDP